jgi:hypothetical protein
LQKRVSAFKGWLRQRNERFIIAVGHGCFWKEFMGKSNESRYLHNCEHQVLRDW